MSQLDIQTTVIYCLNVCWVALPSLSVSCFICVICVLALVQYGEVQQ